MRKINYKSDFTTVVHLKNQHGEKVPWPQCDWSATFWTNDKARTLKASCINGQYTNCNKESDGGILFIFNSHHLGLGRLLMEPHFMLPNGAFSDGTQDIYGLQSLDIELVAGAGDCETEAEVEAILPFIKGEPFTYEDFTPEQIEDLQRPATDAAEKLDGFVQTASKAETIREANEKQRVSAEQTRVAKETKRESAEATRQSQETQRIEAEADREEAESGRVSAEEKRAEEFASWETEIDSKADKAELSNVLAEEPLTPDNFPDINTYTREQLKKDLFIDMWNSKLSLYTDSETRDIDGWDAATDEFIVNGLRFSYADALMIDICSETVAGHPISLYDTVVFPVKTLFWPFIAGEYGHDLARMFCGQSHLEILQIQTRFGAKIFVAKISEMFAGCTALKEIRGTIALQYANSESNLARAFSGCSSLKEVRLQNNKFSISFADSPNLSLDSISYMITYAGNTAPITVTLHPTAYARVTDELFATAASKNITIASV